MSKGGFQGVQRMILAVAPALALACLAPRAGAFQQEPPVQVYSDSGIEISAGLPLREQPGSGFFPVHLQIANHTGQNLRWDVALRNTGDSPAVRYQTSVAVEARQSRAFDLLIPWPRFPTDSPSYQSAMVTVSGPGVKAGSFTLNRFSSGGASTNYVAISESLASASWSKLESTLRPSSPGATVVGSTSPLANARFSSSGRTPGRSLQGSAVRLDELPADARAFSGFGGLWLREGEWRGLDGARRAAIRQWVLDGGQLFVAAAAPAEKGLPGLPMLKEKEGAPLGFGTVKGVKLEGGELPIDDTVKQIVDLDGAPMPPWEPDFSSNWSLGESVGVPTLNAPLLIGFVCLFGILIAPVNLMLLAPPSRRYRLFYTVPLLSVGASVVLLGLIAFGDGVGGVGARNVLVLVNAGENRLSLLQEQASRTRLLLGRSFSLPATVACSFVTEGRRETGSVTLERTGNVMSGDWFRTRSVQSHFLQTDLPSRAAVVLRSGPGAPPELLSTMAGALTHVFYVDAGGALWKADRLTTGTPGKLISATAAEFDAWQKEVTKQFSIGLRTQFERTAKRPGYFYAEGAPGAETTIETLRTIAWNKQTVVCLGACQEGGTP